MVAWLLLPLVVLALCVIGCASPKPVEQLAEEFSMISGKLAVGPQLDGDRLTIYLGQVSEVRSSPRGNIVDQTTGDVIQIEAPPL